MHIHYRVWLRAMAQLQLGRLPFTDGDTQQSLNLSDVHCQQFSFWRGNSQ